MQGDTEECFPPFFARQYMITGVTYCAVNTSAENRHLKSSSTTCAGWPLSRHVKSPPIPWLFAALLPCYSYPRHAYCATAMLLNTGAASKCSVNNKQFSMAGFFSDFWSISRHFSRQQSNSLIFLGFPDKWSPCLDTGHTQIQVNTKLWWGSTKRRYTNVRPLPFYLYASVKCKIPSLFYTDVR